MSKKVSVLDVAKYILQKSGSITAMKLQKLVYYCQAWSLVWDDAPLFKEKIWAWAHGPVAYELFKVYQGKYTIKSVPSGKIDNLNDTQKETIDSILEYYGNKQSYWLSNLTHKEAPWREARKGLPDGYHGNNEITHASMMEYYSGL